VKVAIGLVVTVLFVLVLAPLVKQWRQTRRLEGLWRSLRQRTRDVEVADRLVAGERERHPELSEAACVRRALRQLDRDRR